MFYSSGGEVDGGRGLRGRTSVSGGNDEALVRAAEMPRVFLTLLGCMTGFAVELLELFVGSLGI